MLQVHSSNQLEKLLGALQAACTDTAQDPFVPETVVVQNAGMARWLQQQIAQLHGISANMEFKTPGGFVWEVARYWLADLPKTPPYSKSQLLWRIYALLPNLLPQEPFNELHLYLEGDNGVQLFQLAQQISGLFDQYLVYRPDLILEWQSGDDNQWQAILWRAIYEADPAMHWGDIKQRVSVIANEPPAAELAARISIFGISDMPPLHTEILRAVSNHTSTCLYYLNPCREYWADIEDMRQQARRRARAREQNQQDPTGLLDVGNPLLASWGHAGQAFLDQLLETDIADSDDFQQPQGKAYELTRLQKLQSDILELQDATSENAAAPVTDDNTLQVHSAHSPLREVQILHDQLLRLFEQNSDLKPRDIIVMAPDIDRYAPFVDATFSTALNELHIPWSISDRRLRTEQQLLEGVAALLQLPLSRFESTEVLALLDMPAVRRRFSLDHSSLRILRQWVRESGIRWSLDAAMRKEINLPADDSNSWSFGLKRLFLGFAMPDMEGGLFEGVAPYPDIEGSQSDALQVLQQLVDQCRQWRLRLSKTYTAEQWRGELEQLVNAFFQPDEAEEQALQSVRSKLVETLNHANDIDLQTPIGREVIAEILNGILEDSSNTRQFLTGRVTFSNMVPMRSIPFKVVCIMGLNASNFPRNDRPLSFDLIARHPKRGDRRRRNDDRYLFLETLLSARQILYLSYVGHDIRDNSEKAPSTVLQELIDYANLNVIKHPLQPFSRRYFDGSDPQLVNYKPHWFDAVQTKSDSEIPRFVSGKLSAPSNQLQAVDLRDLIDFFQRPAAAFLATRLDVRLGRADDALEITEPFDLDNLQNWQLQQTAYALCNQGDSKETVRRKLRAYGSLPAGAFGDQLFDRIYDDSIELDRRVLKYQTPEIDSRDLELKLDPFRLSGRINEIRSGGLFDWRFGQLRAKDLVYSWVRHLALCELAPDSVPGRSVLVCQPYTVIFKKIKTPREYFQQLLDVRWQGLESLQPLFPETAFATLMPGSKSDEGLSKYKRWKKPPSKVAENEISDEDFAIVWRGQENPFDEQFEQLVHSVFAPMLDHASFVKAEDDLS